MIELQDMYWWMTTDGTYECKGLIRAKGFIKEFHHKNIKTYSEAKGKAEREAYAFRRKTGVDTLLFDGTSDEHWNLQGYVIVEGKSNNASKRTLGMLYGLENGWSRIERDDKKHDDFKVDLNYCLN